MDNILLVIGILFMIAFLVELIDEHFIFPKYYYLDKPNEDYRYALLGLYVETNNEGYPVHYRYLNPTYTEPAPPLILPLPRTYEATLYNTSKCWKYRISKKKAEEYILIEELKK